jgi:hypothetical protein
MPAFSNCSNCATSSKELAAQRAKAMMRPGNLLLPIQLESYYFKISMLISRSAP